MFLWHSRPRLCVCRTVERGRLAPGTRFLVTLRNRIHAPHKCQGHEFTRAVLVLKFNCHSERLRGSAATKLEVEESQECILNMAQQGVLSRDFSLEWKNPLQAFCA